MCQTTNSGNDSEDSMTHTCPPRTFSPQELAACPLQRIDLHELGKQLDSPHKIVKARMLALGTVHEHLHAPVSIPSPHNSTNTANDNDVGQISAMDGGLAAPLVNILAQAIDQWMNFLESVRVQCQSQSQSQSQPEEKKESMHVHEHILKPCSNASPLYLIANSNEIKTLRQLLLIHLQISTLDSTLAEEMVKGCGSRRHLSKLIRSDVYSILSMHSDLIEHNTNSNTNTHEDEHSIHEDEHGNEQQDAISTDSATATATTDRELYEQTEDSLVEIQDLACELAHSNPSTPYPAKISPYTFQELHARLPLTFDICSPKGKREHFMVGQVTDRQSAQDDVGFVMWPSAVVLSSWLLDHPSLLVDVNVDMDVDVDVSQERMDSSETEGDIRVGVRSNTHRHKRILEIGSGCGLTGLVAARIVENHQQSIMATKEGAVAESHEEDSEIQHHRRSSTPVILSDFNHKVLTNIDKNIQLNGLGKVAKPFHLDFYSQQGTNCNGGWKGSELKRTLDSSSSSFEKDVEYPSDHADTNQPAVDLILAADTICKPSDAVAVANTIYDALVPGGEAIVVSANAEHRFGVDIFEDECKRVGLEVTTMNIADMCDGKLLPRDKDSEDPCGIRQTSGFVDGMTLTMFRVVKSGGAHGSVSTRSQNMC
jgi:predicted nicotinamide N-methyase